MSPRTLTLTAWPDELLAEHGHPVAGRYAEVFWLPVLGPSCLWLLRHASYSTARGPYVVDAEVLARSIGLRGHGNQSPLQRTLRRLVDFDCATGSGDRFALRTHLGPLPERHLARLPDVLQLAHQVYVARHAVEA